MKKVKVEEFLDITPETAELVSMGIWGLYSITHETASYLLTTGNTGKTHYLLDENGAISGTTEQINQIKIIESLIFEPTIGIEPIIS